MSATKVENTIMFQHLVKKDFATLLLRYKEAVGTMLAGIVNMTSQKMVLTSTDLMLEKVAGMTLSHLQEQMSDDLKNQIMEKLAKKLFLIKREFEVKKDLVEEVLGSLSYDSCLTKNRMAILEIGGEDLMEQLKNVPQGKMTICHGDLNLSNLMLVGSELVFIDFEHVVMAPIAYEFGSPTLFADEKSIDMKSVVIFLENLGISISVHDLELGVKLFLADQLTKADDEKRELIIKTARERKII